MEKESRLDFKIREAMHRIEDLYYQTNGACYVSFSGGKDSTVLLALIKMCEDIYTIPKNGIKAVYCDTGIELQATRDFVDWCKDNWYSNIEIIKPKKTFKQVLDEQGKPMKSKLKAEHLSRWHKNGNTTSFSYMINSVSPTTGKPYMKTKIGDKDLHLLHDDFPIMASSKCCDYLKKMPFADYNKEQDIDGYFVGVRTGEGGVRELAAIKRVQTGGKLCTQVKDGKIMKMPIIDWTDDDIEQFITKYNIPLSRAYTEYGMERTGCMGCPFSRDVKFNLETLYKYEPSRYKASMFWLKDVYIAQNVKLPFDQDYEREREREWLKDGGYFDMRLEMLQKYRPEKIKPSYVDKSKFK